MATPGDQERTERATPKRLREAREKGQIARSRDLNSLILLMTSASGVLLLGDSMIGGLVRQMQAGLSLKRAQLFDPAVLQTFTGEALIEALLLFLPFLALLFVAALLAPMALGGWTFSPSAVMPKWDKLDPVKGLGRVFSRRGLVESLKAFAKFALVAVVSVLLLYHLAGDMFTLGNEPLQQGLAHAGQLVGWSFLGLSSVLILVAIVDVPFQLWDHAQKMKMTRQEVRDEHKETEGHPEVKNRIRSIQKQLAQQRMMEDVPTADVVVTNPTHYAVALRYDQESMGAPRVVARGADVIAAQIRKVAGANNVTIVEAPPLARALYFNTEVGQDIPAGLYVAVAQLLAYVYQLRSIRARGQDEPPPPADLPVPDEYLKGQ
jgi:flagellar biosynthetic protein FlhB